MRRLKQRATRRSRNTPVPRSRELKPFCCQQPSRRGGEESSGGFSDQGGEGARGRRREGCGGKQAVEEADEKVVKLAAELADTRDELRRCTEETKPASAGPSAAPSYLGLGGIEAVADDVPTKVYGVESAGGEIIRYLVGVPDGGLRWVLRPMSRKLASLQDNGAAKPKRPARREWTGSEPAP
jgi:hypothetical protein